MTAILHRDVLVAHLDGEAILLHLETKRYFRLNRTGAAVWRGLEQGLDAQEIAERLASCFAVTEGEAANEVRHLVGELVRLRLVAAPPADA